MQYCGIGAGNVECTTNAESGIEYNACAFAFELPVFGAAADFGFELNISSYWLVVIVRSQSVLLI